MGGLLDDVPLNQRQQIWSQYDGASELLDKNGQEGADLYQLQKKMVKKQTTYPYRGNGSVAALYSPLLMYIRDDSRGSQ